MQSGEQIVERIVVHLSHASLEEQLPRKDRRHDSNIFRGPLDPHDFDRGRTTLRPVREQIVEHLFA
jgi:hypothetical protein